MTADTETQAEAQVPGKQKPNLPEGIISPISALNKLKQAKLASQDYKPQQMYGHVKSPGKGDARFPVKHYDALGNVFDEPQVNEHGITTTRPGVVYDEVSTWWQGKGERDKKRAEEKARKAKEKADKAAKAAETTAEAPEAVEDEAAEDEGEFVVAEDEAE